MNENQKFYEAVKVVVLHVLGEVLEETHTVNIDNGAEDSCFEFEYADVFDSGSMKYIVKEKLESLTSE